MQNKGAITLLAVALALVSLYQLFFTYKTNQVEKAAREFANGDPAKERAYLDSVTNQTVYNFLGIAKFTYKECKELEINLGLDLKGGMNVTMEVDVADVVRSLANHTSDPAFNQAIEEAIQMRVSSPKDFVTLFGEAFEKIAPGQSLASPNIFGTHEMKDRIKIGATNQEVLDVIRKAAEGAIDNTFNILRTRIDRFGVAQPNIRKADISGRIIIELPGIKFRPIHLKPFYAFGQGEHLQGVQVHILDYRKARLSEVQFYILQELAAMYPDKKAFGPETEKRFDMFDKVCGSNQIRERFSKNYRFDDIKDYWYKDVESFKKLSRKYYLYK